MSIATRRRVLSALLAGLLSAVAMGAASEAFALPIIQEVYYDAPGDDADHVFTEIFGLPGMDLTGWKLIGFDSFGGGVDRTAELTGAVIPADGLLVIAPATAVPALAAVRDFVPIGTIDWQNGPDSLQLLDPSGNVVDAVAYGDAGTAGNGGEGESAPDVGSGQSLSRDAFGTDTGDNRTDFSAAAPSPGVGPTYAPEPGTGLLLAAGLLGLASRRGRAGAAQLC